MAHTADYPKDGSTLENGKARTASAPGQVRPRYLLSLFSGLFGALVDIPAGLADGDQDALGALSCAIGQVAKMTITGWTCAPDDPKC